MHREYRSEDMRHAHAHAFEEGGPEHTHENHRPLFALTALLGVLLGADLLLRAFGTDPGSWPFGLSLALIAALLGGMRIIYGALAALASGRIGADFALAQACLAALVLGEPFVAAEVVFIALVGEVLEAITANRALRAIHRLFEQAPHTARVRREGVEREIPIQQVVVGDVVLVGAGERIPIDGSILAGRSSVDQAALTGEPIPVDRGPGEAAYAGTLNGFALLEVRAEKVGRETTLGQVLQLVADSQRRKAPLQRAADRYARYFLPVVEGVALVTVVAGYALGWPDVWNRAVAVLVVACPCALVLATPAAIMASMAWLARHGVVIKGGVALERLASCDTFAFDKTGTLTVGRPELDRILPTPGWTEDDLLRLAAAAEHSSRHPLADAVRHAAEARGLIPFATTEISALPGAGVSATWRADGEVSRSVFVGNHRLLTERGIALDEATEALLDDLDARGATPLIVAVDGVLAGVLEARDTVRPEAHDVVHDLKHLEIGEIAILTGDRARAAQVVARRTHIKTVEAELLPADKARWVEQRQAAGRRVAMVGDGINDAPALATAHVGIALAGVGADLAAEAGDLLLMGDPLRVLPDLVRLSRATVAVIRQNIVVFAFGLNATAMASAALGILGPVPAAVLHQAGSLLVLLNAMRLLVFGDWGALPPVRWLKTAGEAVRRFDERIDLELVGRRVLARWRLIVALAVIALLGTYATWGWTGIGPDEVGLLRRYGRYAGRLGPGPHLLLPPPFDRVTRLRPAAIRSLEIGYRTGRAGLDGGTIRWESVHDRASAARRDDEALLLTGDGQLVELAATAQFRLGADERAWRRYAFGSSNTNQALATLAEAAVRSVVSRQPLAELLTDRRSEAERAAASRLQDLADRYGLGVAIVGLDFQEIHPPLPVVDAYRDVSRAESDRRRRWNEGQSYRAERLARAEGQAGATVNGAEAERIGRVARAEGEAEAFLAVLAARASAPSLSDHRRYMDLMESALAGKGKLVLDPANGTRRHLVLPERLGSDLRAAVISAGEPVPRSRAAK
jgi:Cu+-exporting ATPase